MMLRRFVKSVNLCTAKTSTWGAGIINSELVDLILQLKRWLYGKYHISRFIYHPCGKIVLMAFVYACCTEGAAVSPEPWNLHLPIL